jgi:hypothetical protein
MTFTDEKGRPIKQTLEALEAHLRAGGTARVSTTVDNRRAPIHALAIVKEGSGKTTVLSVAAEEFVNKAPPASGPRAKGPTDGRCEACKKKPRYAPSAMGSDKMWWWRSGKWVWRCCK